MIMLSKQIHAQGNNKNTRKDGKYAQSQHFGIPHKFLLKVEVEQKKDMIFQFYTILSHTDNIQSNFVILTTSNFVTRTHLI